MAGTLTISTLSDGTNSTSATNCIQGSGKAWVTFNGTNGTIRASYNVSSVTRSSTGIYTVNFTNAFSDANYSVATALNKTNTSNDGNGCITVGASNVNPTTTSCPLSTYTVTIGSTDSTYVYATFFR